MKGKFTITLFFTFIFFSTNACAETFKGKVIDADTKEPIDGAVVVVFWNEARATIAGEDTRLKDVKETLTDKNGEWVLKGPRGSKPGNIKAIFTFLTGTYYTRPPQFIIFKSGYCSYPAGFGIETCKKNMRSYGVGNGEINELPVLTNREDRLRALPTPLHKDGDREFYKKQREFLRVIDEESKYLGIPEYQILKELENEK